METGYFWWLNKYYMRTVLYFILAFGFWVSAFSQNRQDTIQISRSYKTILIFPEDISESIIGNDFGFIVDLPNPSGSRFNNRILKLYYDELATEKKNFTNLTVITSSGNVYDFMLELTDKPDKLTWHIKGEMANANIGNLRDGLQVDMAVKKVMQTDSVNGKSLESPEKETINDIALATSELYENDPKEYYRLRSYYMQFDKARIPREFVRNNGVFLWLKGVYYNKNEIYIQFKIENKETLDFDVNFLKCFIVSSYKNTTTQKSPIKPDEELLLSYKVPKRIKGNSENHFVLVFKKFTLDHKKRFLLELDEESGNRHISFKIDHKTINNPIPFE